MVSLRPFKMLVVVALFSFLGGILGGWLAQKGGSTALAKEDVKSASVGKYDLLLAKELYVGEIKAQTIDVVNSECKKVGSLTSNKVGGGVLTLGTTVGDDYKTLLLAASGGDFAQINFMDSDFDRRLMLSTLGKDPTVEFRYRGKSRLVLGTNAIVTTATGDNHQIKGSVYAYDKEGRVLANLP